VKVLARINQLQNEQFVLSRFVALDGGFTMPLAGGYQTAGARWSAVRVLNYVPDTSG
jgi:hypothetical protein